jgi:hypothetical protein
VFDIAECARAADTGRVRLLTWPAALCAFCLLAGCGGGDVSGDAQVRQWLPRAEHIRCSSPRKDVTSCEVSVPKRPAGTEHWHCSFEDSRRDAAYSGSHACWTEDGSQESLAESARLD